MRTEGTPSMPQEASSSYAFDRLWEAILDEIPRRRTSFFLTSPLACFLFWVIGIGIAKNPPSTLIPSLVPSIAVLALGVASFLALKRWKRRSRKTVSSTRRVALTNLAYYSTMLLVLSFYSLWIAIGASPSSSPAPSPMGILLAGVYALSIMASLLWAPRSLPRSPVDDQGAGHRQGAWVPSILVAQGCAVGAAVFTGAWLREEWASFGAMLVIGLFGLSAVLLVTVGVLASYRWLALASRPCPTDVFAQHGIRS